MKNLSHIRRTGLTGPGLFAEYFILIGFYAFSRGFCPKLAELHQE